MVGLSLKCCVATAGCPRSRRFCETWAGRHGGPPLYFMFTRHRHSLSVLFSLLMPQALHRFYGAKDLHFLTFSRYRRQPLFSSAARRDLFLQILERVRRRYRLVVL